MFDNIAPTYDRLNHLLSMNIDRLWRRRAVRLAARTSPRRIVDMATGTGDLAIALARRIPQAEVVGADLSPEMLAEARRKIARAGLEERITLTECDADATGMETASADVVTVAFGVRNFADPMRGLAELLRILRPGGEIVVLEISNPRNPVVRLFYRLYFHRILPAVGAALSHDGSAYRYLPASVDAFASPGEFVGMLTRAGFADAAAESLSCGIATIYTARKR